MKTKNLVLVAMFTALTAIGGFLKIPIGDVPITLQFFFTTLSALTLGSKLGALSQLLYLILGLIGIPLFSQGGGISYIAKPSFGYIIGFVFSAYIIGALYEIYYKKNKINIKTLTFICFCGLLITYLIGVPYLYFIFNVVLGKTLSISSAIKIGALIFLPGDIVKILLTSIIAKRILPLIENIKN